uniref:Uncharacterized protein n=1 Tax=Rhizophora mucronata TaxID=61149 RepID=A0A2P2NSK6_RHIMU
MFENFETAVNHLFCFLITLFILDYLLLIRSKRFNILLFNIYVVANTSFFCLILVPVMSTNLSIFQCPFAS